jgi:hypothetical protein
MKFNLSSIVISFFALSFTACNQSVSQHIEKNPYTIKTVQYTSIVKLENTNGTIDLLCNVTYMNPVNKNQNNQEFLIGFYAQNENIDIEEVHVTLNGSEAIEVKNISKDDVILENHGMKNHWASYRLFSFIDNEKKNLNLNLHYKNKKEVINILNML